MKTKTDVINRLKLIQEEIKDLDLNNDQDFKRYCRLNMIVSMLDEFLGTI